MHLTYTIVYYFITPNVFWYLQGVLTLGMRFSRRSLRRCCVQVSYSRLQVPWPSET